MLLATCSTCSTGPDVSERARADLSLPSSCPAHAANIDELSGSVCLDVINQTWSPMFDMVNIFEVFLPQLLRYPNAADPLNGEAAALLMRDQKGYDAKVRGESDALLVLRALLLELRARASRGQVALRSGRLRLTRRLCDFPTEYVQKFASSGASNDSDGDDSDNSDSDVSRPGPSVAVPLMRIWRSRLELRLTPSGARRTMTTTTTTARGRMTASRTWRSERESLPSSPSPPLGLVSPALAPFCASSMTPLVVRLLSY